MQYRWRRGFRACIKDRKAIVPSIVLYTKKETELQETKIINTMAIKHKIKFKIMTR